MNVLIVGNSQAGCLKRAEAETPAASRAVSLHFHVVPGGTGPYLTVRDDRLQKTEAGRNFEARIFPPGAETMALSEFDAIVVSALGYIDGGFKFHNPIVSGAVLAEFEPIDNTREIVSEACHSLLVKSGLERQPGVKLLRSLAESYRGRILVQPFPYPSKSLRDRPDWSLRTLYGNYLGAHAWLHAAKDAALAALCEETGAELLAYPARDEEFWTNADLVRDSDLIHVNEKYGSFVLAQIEQALA